MGAAAFVPAGNNRVGGACVLPGVPYGLVMVEQSEGTRQGAMGNVLNGRVIAITRPAMMAANLAERVRAAGGVPLLFPAVLIADIDNVGPVNAAIDMLDSFHICIFISPIAVHKAMRLISARRSFPPQLTVAAIGRGSMAALHEHGLAGGVAPADGSDSEALLELPEMKLVAGKRIAIFRGEGGREMLGGVLRARGAEVRYVECYRRLKPDGDVSLLTQAWQRNALAAIVVTSGEGLRNLFELAGDAWRSSLQATPLFVSHPRIASAARDLGAAVVVETAAGDEGVLVSLAGYFGSFDAQ